MDIGSLKASNLRFHYNRAVDLLFQEYPTYELNCNLTKGPHAINKPKNSRTLSHFAQIRWVGYWPREWSGRRRGEVSKNHGEGRKRLSR